MKNTKFKYSSITLALASLMVSVPTFATSIGSDMNIKLTPTSAGMGGVGYVMPQDAVSSVYGNPATLTQLKGNTDFTFGATYLNVFNKAESDGSDGLPAFKGDIEMENYLLPEVAVRQRLTDKLVIGSGLQVISGLGADYRNSHPLDPTVTFITFGANMAAAYDISPSTTIGASMTLAYGLLEMGLVSNTGIQEAFGVRGGLGVTHDLGGIKVGLNYNSELTLDFDDVVQTSPNVYSDLQVQQPQEVILGIASTPDLWTDLLLEANVIYKNWENADTYKDIWKDTYTLQLGGQYKLNNKFKLRTGYSYTSDLLKENGLGNSVGGLTSLAAGGGSVPVNPALIQFMQSTLADPFWNHSVTVGMGYAFTDSIGLDMNAGYSWGPDQTIGANKIEVGLFSVGAGVTWEF